MEEFKMADVKVAINGFGRIGRLAFRQMYNAPGYDVVAINDLTSPSMLAHLLKYDTSQGRFVDKFLAKIFERNKKALQMRAFANRSRKTKQSQPISNGN